MDYETPIETCPQFRCIAPSCPFATGIEILLTVEGEALCPYAVALLRHEGIEDVPAAFVEAFTGKVLRRWVEMAGEYLVMRELERPTARRYVSVRLTDTEEAANLREIRKQRTSYPDY